MNLLHTNFKELTIINNQRLQDGLFTGKVNLTFFFHTYKVSLKLNVYIGDNVYRIE